MAEQPAVPVVANSPEDVAYQLMKDILAIEGKVFAPGQPNSADRKQILDTYVECLIAVRNSAKRNSTLIN